MVRIITFIFLAVTVLVVQVPAQADAISGQKAVLVTGASSGLGGVPWRKSWPRVAILFMRVHVRTKTSRSSTASRMSRPSGPDVNNPEQIEAAVKTVTEAGRGG